MHASLYHGVIVFSLIAAAPAFAHNNVAAAGRHCHTARGSPNGCCRPQIQYSPYSQDTMQVYRPAASVNNHRALVVVHGGSWSFGTNRNGNVVRFSRKATRAGYTAFNINYRTFNKATELNQMPAQIQDVQAAIRYIKRKAGFYRINPRIVEIAGFSAGAQLSMLAGSLPTNVDNVVTDPLGERLKADHFSPKVAAVASFSGPTDLRRLSGKLRSVILGITDESQALSKSQSPIFRVTALTVPTFIAQGKLDPLISASSEVYPYARVLTKMNIPHDVLTYRGGHALHLTTVARQNYVIGRALSFLINCSRVLYISRLERSPISSIVLDRPEAKQPAVPFGSKLIPKQESPQKGYFDRWLLLLTAHQ